MFHVNLIKITYTIYTEEMKANQTRHLNYTKRSKRRNEGQKTGRPREKQNGNSEPFPLTVIVVTLPMDLITT